MLTIITWSAPLGLLTGLVWGSSFAYAFKLYRSAGSQNPFWLFIGAGVLFLGLSVAHTYNSFLYDAAVQSIVKSKEIVESDANWLAYKVALTNNTALPENRPMTRRELVEFVQKLSPRALEHYARQGVQSTRNYLMQYINPFFIFKNEEEKIAYAIKFFAALDVYKDAYPEYEITEE